MNITIILVVLFTIMYYSIVRSVNIAFSYNYIWIILQVMTVFYLDDTKTLLNLYYSRVLGRYRYFLRARH